MITVLSAFLGFFSSILPDLLGFLKRGQEHKQEIELVKLQAEIAAQQQSWKMEEINAHADIAETKAIYKTYKTGINWVDAYSGTVRPTITYTLFALYAYVKIATLSILGTQAIIDTPWIIWGQEDQALFAATIAFWFGQRSMKKVMGK